MNEQTKFQKIKDKVSSFNLHNFVESMKAFFIKVYEYKDVKYILFLYLVALIMFGITLITNMFTIPVSGDFVLQEIPFYYNGYDDWWEAIKTGSFPLWDESGFLGVNNIGANSFYYLFNIFFIPVLLFPRSWIPQIQAILIISKFVVAGYAMKKLLEIFKVKDDVSKTIGIAYAFSGWSMFYLWFNHFLEVAVLFPLVLIGIEKVIRKQDPLFLIGSLFISALTNYFFFIAFCFTTVLYALVRYFQYFKYYTKDEKIKTITRGIIAYAISLGLACIILIPAFKSVMSNTRVTSATYSKDLLEALKAFVSAVKTFKFNDIKANFVKLFKVLFVWSGQNWKKNILYPFYTFVYPTITCYNQLLFANSGYDNTLSSIFVYTPLALLLIPSLINSLKKGKISHIISFVGIVILLITPFAYYCFSGFTSVAYGRWELFVVNILCIYIGVNLDKKEELSKWSLDISCIAILIIQIALFKFAYDNQGKFDTNELEDYRVIGAICEMIYTFILYIVMRIKIHKKGFVELIMYIIAAEACVMCTCLLNEQGTASYKDLYGGYTSCKENTLFVKELKKEDPSFYRIFDKAADRDSNNLGMVEGYNGIGTFHSVYDFALNDFLSWSHVTYGSSGWSMGVHEKRANLDTFLGIKYYILPQDDTNVPFGYKLIKENENKKVYENENHIELGYSFDSLISKNEMSSSSNNNSTEKNEILYLTSGILDSKDIEEINKDYNFEVKNGYYDATEGKSVLYTPSIPSRQIKIYKACWDNNVVGEFDGFMQKDGSIYKNETNPSYGDDYYNYTISDATNLLWNSYMEIETNYSNRIAPLAKEKGGAFVTVKQRMGENLEIILYGEEGKELTRDRHMIHYYSKKYDYKYERGFYVNEEVKKIEIRVYDTLSNGQYLVKPEISYEYYDTYKERMDSLKQYEFKNIKKSANKMSFTTDYEDDRFIVLQVPYDKGWKLKMIDENGKDVTSKIYCAQGGFLSFVGKKGNISYSLEYQTPGLKGGLIVLLISINIFSALYIYYSFDNERRNIESLLNLKKDWRF